LTARLRADGVEGLDVPAKLARKVRMLSSGHGRKSDEADAYSVGVAAWTAPRLNATQTEDAVAALGALTEHRDDLVRTRTQTVNRLHALLTQLVPAGHPRGLTAADAAQVLRTVRPRTTLARTLRQLSVELVAEVRRLDRRIAAVTDQLSDAVDASGTTLTAVYGVGPVVAAKLLARTGPVDRFRSADALASYAGVAPIEVSSGDVVRHRLSRAGDRQLNYALHVIAITQIRRDTTGRTYYQAKRAAGKNHKEALRCLKQRLADVVYRTMIRDTETSGPGHLTKRGAVSETDPDRLARLLAEAGWRHSHRRGSSWVTLSRMIAFGERSMATDLDQSAPIARVGDRTP
jgi:transposase